MLIIKKNYGLLARAHSLKLNQQDFAKYQMSFIPLEIVKASISKIKKNIVQFNKLE
jgi:hypothetical protein